MLFDQNRVDAIIHNWKNQVFSNETIPGVPQRHSTCLKPPIGSFRNLASRSMIIFSRAFQVQYFKPLPVAVARDGDGILTTCNVSVMTTCAAMLPLTTGETGMKTLVHKYEHFSPPDNVSLSSPGASCMDISWVTQKQAFQRTAHSCCALHSIADSLGCGTRRITT